MNCRRSFSKVACEVERLEGLEFVIFFLKILDKLVVLDMIGFLTLVVIIVLL